MAEKNRLSATDLAKQTGLTLAQVNQLFDAIVDICASGRCVNVRGFGTFKKRHVNHYQQIIPSTGETVTVPDHDILTFRVNGKLKLRMR